MIDLVRAEIENYEKKQFSWIIQGFPWTRVQALELQKMAIVPDKFININIRKHQALTRIKSVVGNINTAIYGQELDEIANQCYEEYEMNMAGVIETFN